MVTTTELIQRESDVLIDDEFLQHYGKIGMKWGVRKAARIQKQTARIQKNLDRFQRIGSGTASTKDKLLGANRGIYTKKGANKQLQRGANQQAKVAAGKAHVTAFLIGKKGRTMLKDLDFHKQGDAKAKLDRGEKAAIGILAVSGVAKVASFAARVQ